MKRIFHDLAPDHARSTRCLYPADRISHCQYRLGGFAPSPFITPVSTLVGFVFALLDAGQREGWARALRLLALVFGVSLLFESVGVATGLVYGPYDYTNQLGPLFLGLVPYLIPVAWFMMSYPSFVISDRQIPVGWKRWQRILSVAAVGGLVMTAWDLMMLLSWLPADTGSGISMVPIMGSPFKTSGAGG
jgi:Predicted membrane protein